MIAFILAAGESRRFGRCKQVAPIDGLPMIAHVIQAIPKQLEIVVVTGSQSKLVIETISSLSVQTIHNADFENGIGTTIRLAAHYAKLRNSPMLITLADLPFVSTKDYLHLLKSFNGRAVFSRIKETMGPPAIIPEHDLTLLMNLKDSQGAKAVIKDYTTVVIPNASRDIDFADQIT